MPTLNLLMITPSNAVKTLEELARENAEVEIEFLGERHPTEVLAFYNNKEGVLALGTGTNPEHLLQYDSVQNKFFYIDSVPDENAPKLSEGSQIKHISKDIVTDIPVSIYLFQK